MDILMTLSLILARTLMVYSILIWVRILISWFIPFSMPGTFTYYLSRIVDPYLGLFKSKKARLGMLDFSPIVAIGIIEVLRSLLTFFGTFGYITLGYVLSLFINAFWNYCLSLFCFLAGIMLLIKTIASYSRNPMLFASAERFSMAVSPITDFVRQMFFSQRRRDGTYRIVKESTVNLVSLILVVVLYFILAYLCGVLSQYAIRLPF